MIEHTPIPAAPRETEQNCDPVRGEIARQQAVFLDIEPGFETAEAIRNRANGQ